VAEDKIKRSITWIRKALEITEKTTNPGTVAGEIIPNLDVLGWDRYSDSVSQDFFATNSNNVASAAVPEGVLRFITEASMLTDNNVLAFTMWLELVHSGLRIGLSRPFLLPAVSSGVQLGLERPILLQPGDNLRANLNPASGVGSLIVLRTRSIDLPIGEYVPPL